MTSPLSEFLSREIEAESFPGASALVASSDAILDAAVLGDAALEPDRDGVTEKTLFDLASLTKPLCTGALFRAAEGLDLSWSPGRFFPAWKKTRHAGITLESLLTHTSGLPAWYPLYVRGEGAQAYRQTLSEIEPSALPGSQVIYSDLNFLLAGEVLEAWFSSPIDRAFQDLVAVPAGSGARFLPERGTQTAATEKGDKTEREMTAALGLIYERFRTGVVRGEVHDGNAHRRGGVAGHAGLFGTARDVWVLARTWLDPATSRFREDRTPAHPEARGLAWQGRRGAGSAHEGMPSTAFGHTGFTGTSVWLDPDRGRVYVLLTNRIHPEVKDRDFNPVRRRFHEVVAGAD